MSTNADKHGSSEQGADNIEMAVSGKEKPAKKWHIKVDKTEYTVEQEAMTGREILVLAQKVPPERYRLMEKFSGGRVEPVALEQVVHFSTPGLERFLTIPLDQTEGIGAVVAATPLRHQFALMQSDNEFLDSLHVNWETLCERNQQWVIIKQYIIPAGYNQPAADVALLLPPGYRDCQIDMAYFFPALERVDRKPIGGLATMQLDGRIWQRWSRHRTAANPWRPGVDEISTHMALVNYWLEREVPR